MSYNIKTAVIIGAGNVAWHMGRALQKKNIKIIQIVGRSADSAKILADELKTEFELNLNHINQNADIYIIAVTDNAIEKIVINLKLSHHLVVHTSGSTPLSVFEGYFKNFGVLYPYQTFTKSRELDFSEAPVCIEANSEENVMALSKLAALISNRVISVNSETRAKLHMAAVFASNFTNYMYCIAEQILQSNQTDFSLLHPLILETALKAINIQPAAAQTGPAVRRNHKIMKKHLDMLEKEPLLKKIYTILSKSIQNKLTKEL